MDKLRPGELPRLLFLCQTPPFPPDGGANIGLEGGSDSPRHDYLSRRRYVIIPATSASPPTSGLGMVDPGAKASGSRM